jgi:hypothetical protein
MMKTGVLILFVSIVTALFAAGFYYFQRRFWPQDRNDTRTAPPSPPEGMGNELGDNSTWRPPKEG